MEYRRFGNLGFRVSALGFGCMRLPTVGGDSSNIDEPEATRMLHYAIDNGVNYLDTGYPYHGGNSERFLGRALKGGYRQRVWLATKLLSRALKGPDDMERMLDEQLERLQTDYVDVYLLHGLRGKRWQQLREYDVLTFLDKARASGRIRAVGFSFHDTFDMFQEIIDSYDGWDACQFQYNYMNENYQAGTRGLRYAASKGLATIIMEPLLGGKLANPPEAVRRVWDSAAVQRSPAEWALQWLWNKPEVSVVLSGMSTMSQVEENVAAAARSGVGLLTSAELEMIDKARAAYEALSLVPCTACAYCMPCPNGVDIPRCFTNLNAARMYGFEDARKRYKNLLPDESKDSLATSCIACRECEDKCPQGIPISEWMPIVDGVLGQDRPLEEFRLPE